MANRQKFDFERLNAYCHENNVTLLEDYSDNSITKTSLIKGKCVTDNCVNAFEKRFIYLTKNGGYCVDCIKIKSKEKVKNTRLKKYENGDYTGFSINHKNAIHAKNLNTLLCYCEENKLELLEDYTNSYLHKKSFIKIKCNNLTCDEPVEKRYREFFKTGAYCNECKNNIRVEKNKKTCLEKYGVEYYSQTKEYRENFKKTCLEKYGVEHAFQSEDIKNKIKESNLQKYGVEYVTQNASIREKVKQTFFEKYGCEHVFQNKGIKEKFDNTILQKYGVKHVSQNLEIKNKIKTTNLKKIGVEYPMQSQGVKEKVKQTNLKKYGVENPAKSQEFKNKTKETNFKKLGVFHPSQTEEVKNKVKQTNLEKYGTEYTFQNENIKIKIKETHLQKLGVEYPTQSQEVRNKVKETNLQKLGVEYPSQNQEIKQKTKETCLKKYGCEYTLQSEIVKNKTKETCLKNYGCEHHFQNVEIMEKNIKTSFRRKEYVFPSGKIEKVQGYEPFALDELIINEKIDESDIITGVQNVPEIWYNDANGKKHRYYVDIFIPSQNRCIEVKSEWTYNQQINSVLLKENAVKELGYNYEMWIYDNKGNKKCYDASS